MINSILDFIKDCPFLRGATFNVNYTDPTPLACSVGQTGEVQIHTRYADGGSLCSISAEIFIRCPYSSAEGENVNSALLCSQVEKWISECNKRGILPGMGDGVRAVSLEVVKGFRLVETASVDAVYRATVKLTLYMDN